MEKKEFITATVIKLKHDLFDELKKHLLGEYIIFDFLEEKAVDQNMLAEKLSDYFSALEIKSGVDFDKVIEKQVDDWAEIVKKHIEKIPKSRKEEPEPSMQRALRYYERALKIKDSRHLTLKQLMDYSRIMMCIYMAIINGKGKKVKFDYASTCLNISSIIMKLKEEKNEIIFAKVSRYNLKELYGLDTALFIVTMLMYYHIKNNEIEGDY